MEKSSTRAQTPLLILDDSIFNSILAPPYQTYESQAAVQFWLRLTGPELTDCPVVNQIHNTLGSYAPQAAWHLTAVRYSLLSAASTALVLGSRSTNMDETMKGSLSRQSVRYMHLAIKDILGEREVSLSSVLSAVLIAITCGWIGRWDECRRHLHFCVNLGRDLVDKGECVEEDMIIAAHTMVTIMDLLPSTTSVSKTTRTWYAYRVITSAGKWINNVLQELELDQSQASEPLIFLLSSYRTRMRWILQRWKKLARQNDQFNPLPIEETTFRSTALHVNRWLSTQNGDGIDFDMRLFTAQLTMAMKTTLMYGAGGDAQQLQEAAIACHTKALDLTLLE